MALFGKKKKSDDEAVAGADGAGAGQEESGSGGGASTGGFSPEGAKRFFDHAETMQEASNYEYSMVLWLQGLAKDPSSMQGIEGFFSAANGFRSSGKKKAAKETHSTIAAQGQISKFLKALLAWGLDPNASKPAVEATQMAGKFNLQEAAVWLGQRAMNLASQQKSPAKKDFKSLYDVFLQFELFDLAVQAGEMAVKLDAKDTELAAAVRNLSARATVSRGGYENQEEGGFRSNLRDADAQQRLEEQNRIVKSEDVRERGLDAAKADYEQRPDDKPTIMRYVKALLDHQNEESEETALGLLQKTYESTNEFRFRENADALRVKRQQRVVSAARKASEAAPGDESAKAAFQAADATLNEMRVTALEAAVEAYPTDLGKKFNLGKSYFKCERFEDAIGMLQEAKTDSKRRSEALNLLAMSFQRIGWHDAAMEQFRQALEHHEDHEDDMGMELRYGLMSSLHDQGRENDSLEAAQEAFKIASAIAMTKFNFRDIREQRDAIKQLVEELKR